MTNHRPIQAGIIFTRAISFLVIIGMFLVVFPMRLAQAKSFDPGIGLDSLVEPLVKLQTTAVGEWVDTGSMINARHLHKATLLNDGFVLVSGGITGDSALSNAELYDPAAQTWTIAGSMTSARYDHTSTLLPDGKVLVAGGLDGVALSSAEMYDPSTGTWVPTGELNIARYDHTATLLPNGNVLVSGGHDGSSPIANAELFDPATGAWTLTASMHDERWLHASTLLPDGKVLVTGGEGISGFLSSAELFDPGTGTWSLTSAMNTDHCYHSAALLLNGQVLVAGDVSTGSVELYDPSSDTWTVTSPMSVARRSFASALLPNGRVLVAGGEVEGISTESSEIYDPATGLWSDSGLMHAPRAMQTATLLTDGSVLIAGGFASDATSGSAELYIPPNPTPAGEDVNTQGEPAEALAEPAAPESSDVKAYYVGPVVTVHLTMNHISSYAWPQNKPLTLTIDDPDNGVGIDYSQTIPVSGISSYSFDFYPTDFVIETGQLITVTDGTTTKTLTVAYLEIIGHDWDMFTVRGKADPGVEVAAGICNQVCYVISGSMYVADSNGYWRVESYFHFDPADYNAGAYLTASTSEPDWDTTKVIKNLPYPQFGAYVYSNTITGWDWPGGASLTITVDDPVNGAGVDYTGSVTVDGSNPEDPHFSHTLNGFDLQEGQLVTVTDGINTKSHTITSLTITNVDFVTDHVSGLAEPGSEVFVYATGLNSRIKQELIAASDGTWTADYSSGLDIVDLKPETVGYVEQLDEDYDITNLTFTGYLPAPTITKITPMITGIGSSAYTLIVTGTNFSNGAKVIWGGSALATTFISSTQLSAAVPDGFISTPTAIDISVVTPLPGGGTSNTITHHAINFSPEANDKLATNHVSFDWDDIPDANLYTIQLSLYSNFNSILLNTTTASSNYSYATALTNSKSYYWRIKARFGSEWSDWSSTWMFNSMNPPLAPVLTSPGNGAITNNNTPSLSWNAVTNADHYQVQISKSTSFSVLEQDSVLDPGALTYTAVALPDGMHYWRVRGIDSVGAIGAWSAYRSFTVDTIPQAVPAMVSPVNGAVQLTTIPKLTAGTVSGGKYYQFQVDDTEDFIDPSVNVSVTTYYYTLTSAQALPFGTSWWRVRSVDAAGNASGWSTPRSFIVTILKTPVNNSYTTDTTPAFAWATASGALEYHIQADDSELFDSPEIDLNRPVSTSYTPLSALPYGLYNWRMQVRTASGWGNWTPVFTFTVTPAPPPAPVLKSPANAALTNDNTPTLEWNAAVNAVKYEIQISKSTSFGILEQTSILDPGVLTYTASALPDGTHYWRVRSINYLNIPGAWSAYRSFTVDTVPQAVPAMVSPANGAVQLTTIPKLTAGTVSGGKYYQFEVDDTEDFIDPSVDVSVTTYYYTLTSAQALPFGTSWWRVRSVDAAGNPSGWSTPRNFIVTILKTPVNTSYTTDTTPAFAWAAASGALEYHIQADDSELFDSPEIDLNRPVSTSYTPLSALPYGLYNWRMQVRTASGWGNWTPVFTFTVTPALPAAPVLKSPANAALTNDNTPTLEWNAAVNAVKYEIQISKSTSFGILEQTSILDPGVLTYTAAALPDGMHYWRVRSINYLNIPGAWSAYRSFTVDTSVPGLPTLSAPAAGASVRGTPKYSWLAASGAKYYQFEYAVSADFSDVVYTSGEQTLLYLTPPQQALGTYYWHVRAKDAAGNLGGWSAYRQITIKPLLPVAPVLVSPASGSSVSITTPTFNWNAVPDATSYEIQVDNSSTFSSPEASGSVAATWFTSGYLPNGTYYWRVRAKNIIDESGAWSAARSVIVNVPANSTTTVVSVSSAGVFGNYGAGIAQISENGRFVVYSSMSSNLVTGDTNDTDDAFVHDQQTDVTSLVSISSTGIQGIYSSLPVDISADGRFILFDSSSDNLVLGDTNTFADVFVRDRQLNQTTRISLSSSGIEGNGNSAGSSISGDGRFVVFSSEANNLVSGDTNGVYDVFVHDRQTGQTNRISLSSSGTEGNDHSGGRSISGDGRNITFVSMATNLVSGDTNGKNDIFVHDMLTGNTVRISISSTGTQANDHSGSPSISGDGRYVAFDSAATNLVVGDTTDEYDVYLHDTVTGETRLISVSSAGEKGNYASGEPEISANGRFVAFTSCATNLVSVDTNGLCDIFVHDLLTGENSMASINSGGGQGDRDSYGPSISGEGRYVAFESDAWGFVNGDYLFMNDVFVHEFR